MEEKSQNALDYCDLVPGKICDNCCRCLDMDKPYNEIEARLVLTDRIDESGEITSDDFYDDNYYEDYDEGRVEDCDSSRVAPIEIDPVLMAEWERRLKEYEAQRKAAYMHTLRGVRKRT